MTSPLAAAMTEGTLLVYVLKAAAVTGWRTYHTHDSRHSASGFPDLVMVRQGRILFAELKSEKGTLSAEQVAWLHDLEPAEVYVWRPSQWLDRTIETVLREPGAGLRRALGMETVE